MRIFFLTGRVTDIHVPDPTRADPLPSLIIILTYVSIKTLLSYLYPFQKNLLQILGGFLFSHT